MAEKYCALDGKIGRRSFQRVPLSMALLPRTSDENETSKMIGKKQCKQIVVFSGASPLALGAWPRDSQGFVL